MIRSQILGSGLQIRQDFRDAIRPIFFQTDFEEFLYATHGGTLFIVSYRSQFFALTCRHVFKDFEWGQLFIPGNKIATIGDRPAPIKTICYPSSPTGAAVGGDITDLCIIEFADDIAPSFFGASAYLIDSKTIGSSQTGDRLRVAGVLKNETRIDPPEIQIGYCVLELQDVGNRSSDVMFREAFAQFAKPNFSSVVGISGSPVFNDTANVLCGMVVRGGLARDRCTIRYIDGLDIMQMLMAVSAHAPSVSYAKKMTFPTKVRI